MVELVDEGEVIIGRAGNANDEINVTSTGINKSYCGNCKKKPPIHCIHGTKKKGGPIVLLKDRCSSECECRCRRFYVARNGRLKSLDTVDDTDPLEGFAKEYERGPIDDIIDKINEKTRKENAKNQG